VLYQAYEARSKLLAPLYGVATAQTAALSLLPAPLASAPVTRAWRAATETICALELTHRRPGFGIDRVALSGDEVAVSEHVVASTPFATLVRFAKEADTSRPRLLVVPGLAGHFATLVKGTIRALLPDHEVFVVDWHNARDVPVGDGRFGLDEYVAHLIDFLEAIGPGTHLMAVCQPCVQALAAAAVMAEGSHPAQPQSLILLAGPVDARINPGPVNEFAANRLDAVARRMITTVPSPYRGAGRRVYPGFLQAMGFIGLDPRRHLMAFTGLARDLAAGRQEEAEKTKAFYDEYFAVLDVPEEFYLETATRVFRDYELARGVMRWRGRRVDPAAIETALFTIEAEKDEMCPPGQTHAAHDLCRSVPSERRRHHLQAGVGHYGVFSGTRFEQEILPQIRSFVVEQEQRRSMAA
jgi:poly(3-hydroxybutyrate) depolymerase